MNSIPLNRIVRQGEREYQRCVTCIMDTTDPVIVFDQRGRCNHCQAVDGYLEWWNPDGNAAALDQLVDTIKRDGKGQDYDVVIGLSGGVDSSYLVYQASKLSLRALIIHVDTGWNSELAVKNVETLVTRLGFDLHTLVVKWEEMQDLQLAFFKSGVPNQDVPQDHAIAAGFLKSASQFRVRWALNGSNLACESILPPAWGYDNLDLVHIKDIHHRFGHRRLREFPTVSYFENAFKYRLRYRLNVGKPLNLLRYNKQEAIEQLESIGWRYYGGKHYESRFTKFFQSWYLPTKWGYDKRLAHLSSLVVSGQVTREAALNEFIHGSLPVEEIELDKAYMARKLAITPVEFNELMNVPCQSHSVYRMTKGWVRDLRVGYDILLRLLGSPTTLDRPLPEAKRRIVHVHESPLTHASRDMREAWTAVDNRVVDDVLLVGRSDPRYPAVERMDDRIRLHRVPLMTRNLPAIKILAPLKMLDCRLSMLRVIERLRPSVIHCHSLSALPACVAAKKVTGARLVYDTHELETERSGLKQPLKTYDKYRERRLIRNCDAVLTVCNSIADWYAATYRIARPVVVRNIPSRSHQMVQPRKTRLFRDRFGIPDDRLVFLYQGALFKGRRVEQFIDVFSRTPDRHVVFMGYGDLEPIVERAAAAHANIHFIPAVSPDSVVAHTAGADVGLVGVDRVCLSYYYSLPNKLFEYLSAGLPVVANDWPEMGSLVKRYNCGWLVGDGADDWLATIRQIDAASIQTKAPGVCRAAQELTWEGEEAQLLDVYRRLLPSEEVMKDKAVAAHGRMQEQP